MGANISQIGSPEKVELPKESAYLLEYHYRMRRRSLINFQEIMAFSQLTGIHIVGYEAEAIMNIDSIFEASNG